jgi:hypothetical protein
MSLQVCERIAMATNKRNAAALREAMTLLLAGQPHRTDGQLLWRNVWVEAGVSKATAYRAREIMAEWDAAVRGRARPTVPAPNDVAGAPSIARETVAGYRSVVLALTGHVQAVTAALEEKDRTIRELRDALARRTDPATPS